MADFESIIKENLDCPICKDLPVGHIFICERGHSVCSRCRNRIQRCPICKGSLTQIRNICAEKIAATILKNCEYSIYGCTVQSMGFDLMSHEETCSFRPYRCDLPGCTILRTNTCEEVEITLANTTEHMRQIHNLTGTISDNVLIKCELTEEEIRRKICNDSKSQARFFKCYGLMFLAVMTLDTSDNSFNYCICTSLSMLEKFTEYSGDSFKARISIESSKYSLSWQGPVHDSKKSLTEVFQTGACLSIKLSNIVAFCNQSLDQQTRSYQVLFSIIKT